MVEKDETGRYGVEDIVRLVFGRVTRDKGSKWVDHVF